MGFDPPWIRERSTMERHVWGVHMDGMTDVSAMSDARELWKYETATELLSIVDTGGPQLMIRDDYGDSWFIEREDIREMRDALTGWLDRTEHVIGAHEGLS